MKRFILLLLAFISTACFVNAQNPQWLNYTNENSTKWIGTYDDGLAVYNENGIPVYVEENTQAVGRATIFPNPADNKLTIELAGKSNISYLEIINMEACLVKSQSVANNRQTINVGFLPAGIYVLRIYTEKGIINKKLIKQ